MAEEVKGKNIRAVVTFKDDAAALSSTAVESSIVTPQEKVATFAEDTNSASSSGSSLATLAKEVAATSTVKESVLADKGNAYDSSEASGTIIRETKRKRFRLLPAMAQASKEWFEDKKEAYDQYQHPYHPIAKADARKEVIEAAVTKSAVAPREDFQTVADRLKEADRKPVATTITLKAKSEVPQPQWASITQSDEVQKSTPDPAVPDTQAAKTDVEVSPQVGFAPVQNTSRVPESVTPRVEVAPQQATEPIPPLTEVEVAPEAPVPQEIGVPERVAQTQEEIIPQSVKQPAVSQVHVHKQKRERVHFDPRYFAAAFLFLAIIGGVATSFYIFKQEDIPQQKAVVYTIPGGINAPQQGFTLPVTREDVLSLIVERLQANNGVVQLYATFTLQDGTQKPATSEQIFTVLNPRTSASFNRNVPELTFGGLGQEPFILMKTQNFDTAFAGMLAWEKTMSADLSPLFGAPVVMSFDPSARTDTQVREAFFKDTIASNKNVRLLLDEEGRDRIVYTFVNQNTVLITTTRTALDALLPLVR